MPVSRSLPPGRTPAVSLVRPGARHEAAFLAAARRSRELHAGLVVPPRDAAGYAVYLKGARRPSCERYLVVAGGELVGAVALNEIVRGALQGAFLGYYAFVPHAGTGRMTRGVALALDRAFGELGLHRVEANIQPHNEPSRRLVQRLGFALEGFSPAYLKVSGRWRDHERWALRAPEWRRLRGRDGPLAGAG